MGTFVYIVKLKLWLIHQLNLPTFPLPFELFTMSNVTTEKLAYFVQNS